MSSPDTLINTLFDGRNASTEILVLGEVDALRSRS